MFKKFLAKRYVWVVFITVTLLLLTAPMYVFSETSGEGQVIFEVHDAMTLTVHEITFGQLMIGDDKTLENEQPVDVSSPVDWNLSVSGSDFAATGFPGITIGISNLSFRFDGTTYVVEETPKFIASGVSGSSSPQFDITLQVPNEDDLAGKTFTATLSYTLTPR